MESSLRACLAEAASTTRWCDVHLCCGGRLFKAHRVVLSSVSTFLRNLLLSRSEEDFPSTIVLPDFTGNAMSAVMSYIYNGEVLIPNTILIEFLNIINVLQISIDKRYLDYLREQIDIDHKHTARVDKCRGDEIKNSDYINAAGRHDYGSTVERCNHMDLEALIKSDRISKRFSPSAYDTEDPSNEFESKVKSDNVLNSPKKMYVACTDRREEDEERQNILEARDLYNEYPLPNVDNDSCLANCVPTIANDTNLCSTSGRIETSPANSDIRHTSTKSYAVCAEKRDVNSNIQNTEITFALKDNCNNVVFENIACRSSELRDIEGKYISRDQIEIDSSSNDCIQCHSVESSASPNKTVNNDNEYRNAWKKSTVACERDLPSVTNVLPLKPITFRFNQSVIEQNDLRLKEGSILRPVPSLLPITSKMNFVHTRHEEFRKMPDLLDLSMTSMPRNMTNYVTQNLRSGYYGIKDFTRSNRYCGSDGSSPNSGPHYGLVSQNVSSSFPAIRPGKRSAYNKALASPWCTRGPICYRSNQTNGTASEIYPYTPITSVTHDNLSDIHEKDNTLESNDFNNKTDVDINSNVTSQTRESLDNDKNNNLSYYSVEEESNDSRNSCLSRLDRLPSAGSISNRSFKETHVEVKNNKQEKITTSVFSETKLKNPHSIDKIMMRTTEANLRISEVNDNCAIKCEICSKMFTSKSTMAAHVKSHSSQGRYHCDQCDKSFSQLRNYKYHVSVHRGTKEFAATCNVCGKYFNDRGYLSSHMKIHRNRKEYQCPHCPKSFNQRVAYNMHVRIHTGVKPHVCESCGKAFSRKMLLKQHQRTHSGEKPYACAACGKRFADRSNMTLHARLHSGVKPFSCTMCPKSFTKKHHLKTHLNYRTGNKPYACERCGLAFSQSSNMRTHMKKCTPKMAMESFPIDNMMQITASNNI